MDFLVLLISENFERFRSRKLFWQNVFHVSVFCASFVNLRHFKGASEADNSSFSGWSCQDGHCWPGTENSDILRQKDQIQAVKSSTCKNVFQLPVRVATRAFLGGSAVWYKNYPPEWFFGLIGLINSEKLVIFKFKGWFKRKFRQ